ncbi:MAG: NADPH-dependent reductase [Jatrophihabitantaceae bacterium]|nr:NADPH-dependent reductase [Jatrophihabitantaceae bacterium]
MRIGLIGSGFIGGSVARLALAQGHEVILSNSRTPDTLADLVADLGPGASAALAADAADAGEIVVVTVPFKNYTAVPVEPLAGKIVIDTNNYYFERDGHFSAIDDGTQTPSGALAEHLPTSRIVKAFNNIQWEQLQHDGLPAGSPNRRALSIAGDDAEAKAAVTALIDSFGYDVVDAGGLVEGRRFDRDKPAYGPRATADELREMLARG